MTCIHDFIFVQGEAATWSSHGGEPAEPSYYQCTLCPFKDYSGNPEAIESEREAEFHHQLRTGT